MCKTRKYDLTVTNGLVSPDSGPERMGVLINGKLGGPEINVKPGDTLKVNITNQLTDYNDGFQELTIHWHGFDMRDVPFLDGTGHMSQCPIEKENSMMVEFVVNEEPGTYMYHSHTNVLVADGLAGPLIVQEEEPEPDAIVVLSEWFSKPSPELAKGLNGRFPSNSSDEGQKSMFAWVGTPRSLLMNYQGCYQDCSPTSSNQQECTPDPECSTRYSIQVLPDSVYRIRLIGAGSLVYQIVCFEGHNVTLVAIDARPVNPLEVGECVDVNLGQRRDVLLRTQNLKNQTSFWITGRVSGRLGMPASYGVLQYVQDTKDKNQSIILPESPAPQPGDVPPSWVETGFINNITSPARVVEDYVNPEVQTKTVLIEMAQSIMQQTNQLRWLFSNVAFLATPSCTSSLELLEDPDWLSPQNPYLIESAADISKINITDIPGLGQNVGSGESFILANMNYDRQLMPEQPVAGVPIIELSGESVIDVIIQNMPSQDMPGVEVKSQSEQHPIHLHGHHFYLLGTGDGDFTEIQQNNSSWRSLLNFENPQYADTLTVGKEGWVYLRFITDNPGLWPIHCHISWHEYMGMLMLFAENAENIPPTPKDTLPRCPEVCVYNAAPFDAPISLSDNTSLPIPDVAPAAPSSGADGRYTFAKAMTGALLVANLGLY